MLCIFPTIANAIEFFHLDELLGERDRGCHTVANVPKRNLG